MNTNTLDINQYLNFIQEVDYDKIIAEQEYLIDAITLPEEAGKKFSLMMRKSVVKKFQQTRAKYGELRSDQNDELGGWVLKP